MNLLNAKKQATTLTKATLVSANNLDKLEHEQKLPMNHALIHNSIK